MNSLLIFGTDRRGATGIQGAAWQSPFPNQLPLPDVMAGVMSPDTLE